MSIGPVSSRLFRCIRNATVRSPFLRPKIGLCIIANVSLFIGASATCRIGQATYRVSARGQACVPAGTFLDGTRLEANKRSELIPGKSEFNLGPCRWKFTLASMAYPPAHTDNTEPADRGGSSLTFASDLSSGKLLRQHPVMHTPRFLQPPLPRQIGCELWGEFCESGHALCVESQTSLQ